MTHDLSTAEEKREMTRQPPQDGYTLSGDQDETYRIPTVVDLGRAEHLTQGQIINGPHDGNTPTNPAHFKKR